MTDAGDGPARRRPASSPEPTPEEVAAVTAAVVQLWPGAQVEEIIPTPGRWRFSGRDWTQPVPSSQARPWRG